MKNIDSENISRMVEAYFSCSLTVKEEKDLGRILAAIPRDRLLPAWEDALAELSLAARARCQTRPEDRIFNENASRPVDRIFRENASRPKFSKNAPLKLAASVALIAAIGIAAFFSFRTPMQTDTCYAYVDGKLITDRQDISRLMDQQLGDMASAQEEMMASVNLDFSEMAAYIEDNE